MVTPEEINEFVEQAFPGATGRCEEVGDGWAVADAERTAVVRALGREPSNLTRAEFVQQVATHGIAAASVLELDEVLAQPLLARRDSLHRIDTGEGAFTSILAVPLGLTLTPALRAQRMSGLGADAAEFSDHAPAGA